MCSGGATPSALGGLITALQPRLVWLDLEAAFDRRPEPLDHAAWLLPLGACRALRVALLPAAVPPAALGALAPSSAGASELQLLRQRQR